MFHSLWLKGWICLYVVVIIFPYYLLCFLLTILWLLGVTVLVGDPLGAAVCHRVDVATAGHLRIVDVRRFHMRMGRLLLPGI